MRFFPEKPGWKKKPGRGNSVGKTLGIHLGKGSGIPQESFSLFSASSQQEAGKIPKILAQSREWDILELPKAPSSCSGKAGTGIPPPKLKSVFPALGIPGRSWKAGGSMGTNPLIFLLRSHNGIIPDFWLGVGDMDFSGKRDGNPNSHGSQYPGIPFPGCG